MPERTVYLLHGSPDKSHVYHTRRDCPALTHRIGWTQHIMVGTMLEDGTISAKPDFATGPRLYIRRPCHRCEHHD